MRKPVISVVGIGEDGCVGLSSRAFNAVTRSQILVGGERHLEFFPDFHGEKIVIKSPMKELFQDLKERSGESYITILASGDPLCYGIGGLIQRYFDQEEVAYFPNLSSIQLAFAACGMSWQDASFDSVHGRSIEGLATRCKFSTKVALLTDSENSPQRIARHLLEYGDEKWDAFLCEDLGGPDQRCRWIALRELAAIEQFHPLNVLILKRPQEFMVPPTIPLEEDDAYQRRMPLKGLITKQEVRILSLAKLKIRPESIVWDIGAGSGAIAIEAAHLARKGRVYAIECQLESVEHCQQNVKQQGVDNVEIRYGEAPEALAGLPQPDAVFIGGSKGHLKEILHQSFQALSTGGRLVANAVTLENVTTIREAIQELGIKPDLCLVQISRGKELAGRYLRYEALNPIHIFTVEKS